MGGRDVPGKTTLLRKKSTPMVCLYLLVNWSSVNLTAIDVLPTVPSPNKITCGDVVIQPTAHLGTKLKPHFHYPFLLLLLFLKHSLLWDLLIGLTTR